MPIIVSNTATSTNPIAGVILSALFLNDATDPFDVMAFTYVGESYRVTRTQGGGVEGGYASGRSRTYSTEDDVTSVAVNLAWVNAEQVAWLEAHRGRVVCWRDSRGRKVFGAYHDVPVEVSTMPTGRAIDSSALTLTSVTFDEAV